MYTAKQIQQAYLKAVAERRTREEAGRAFAAVSASAVPGKPLGNASFRLPGEQEPR